jgi:anaerobic magnesium-protoporphyrin IX monomethyl ester cyclase
LEEDLKVDSRLLNQTSFVSGESLMRVLLLNPPFLPYFSRTSRSPEVSKGGTLYYPIWLAYASGVLEKKGFEVMLLDSPARKYPIDQTMKEVASFDPDLSIIDTSTPSIYNDVEIARNIKNMCPESFVMLVGTHPSARSEQTMNLAKEIDAVARKEYDYTVLELAQTLDGGGSCRDIKGLSYREKNKIVHNPDRPFIEDLDNLPFVSKVYKKHLRIEDYFYAANLHPVVTILSGRGCPNLCRFCLLPQTFTGRQYRFRSPENLIQELEYVKQAFPNVKEVFFEDDTLTANRQRIRRICLLIIQGKLDLTWSCNSRANLDYSTLELMKKAGCRLLCVGYESGCQKILNNVKKGISAEYARKFTQFSKRVGIKIHGCFVFGLPGETLETIGQTIQFAKSLNLDSVQFYPVMVYPGTELYEWAKENGYLSTEDYSQWLTKEGVHNCIFEYPHLSSSALTDMCDVALKEYYFRLSYIVSQLKESFEHPSEIKRIMRAMRVYLRYNRMVKQKS